MDTKLVDPSAFRRSFNHFQLLMVAESGQPFSNFFDGLINRWEGYKPKLRDRALLELRSGVWKRAEIGNGTILHQMIKAIEIQERPGLTNNLVFWQNRYGPSGRAHRALLRAMTDRGLRNEIETALYDLFRSRAPEGEIFERLSLATERKYPLLAYIFFLKDMSRFTPIHPTGFDRAFHALGINFTTLRNCSWANYRMFTEILCELSPLIEREAGLKNIRLIDAHSFCWVFATLLKREVQGRISIGVGKRISAYTARDWEKSVDSMVKSVVSAVKYGNGQVIEKVVKNKELRMTAAELKKLTASLMEAQRYRCKLTGIPLQPHGAGESGTFWPSLDRIDSAGHYEVQNLQVVCRFVNFWKGNGDNEEFRRLLGIVRSYESP